MAELNGETADPVKIETLAEGETGALLQFAAKRYDFGKLRIKKNPQIPVDFEFTNTGNEPLVILKADVSCGCLSADYPKTPIQPGEKGKITVTVDTKDQKGEFNKHLFVKSNAVNDVELLRIKGTLNCNNHDLI
jgi:hypothetical protein